MILVVQKKNRLGKYLFFHSESNLTESNFLLIACLKWHLFQTASFTLPYSKLNILTELNANDLKFISIISASARSMPRRNRGNCFTKLVHHFTQNHTPINRITFLEYGQPQPPIRRDGGYNKLNMSV